MKNLFLIISIFALTLTASAQRFGTTAREDNTGRVITYAYVTPVYSASVTITPAVSVEYVKPATLTGACTIIANDTRAIVLDELTFIFTSDASGRTVTFGANFVPNGTLAVAASKQATVKFVYDGTNYVELCRTLQP